MLHQVYLPWPYLTLQTSGRQNYQDTQAGPKGWQQQWSTPVNL